MKVVKKNYELNRTVEPNQTEIKIIEMLCLVSKPNHITQNSSTTVSKLNRTETENENNKNNFF